MKETIIRTVIYRKKIEKERHTREKVIKDITKRKAVSIVVTNHVEYYKQKMTFPQMKITPSDATT